MYDNDDVFQRAMVATVFMSLVAGLILIHIFEGKGW